MSADNWEICPSCIHQARADHDEHAAAVYATYGKVAIADFDKARAALKEPDPEDYRTFREDYEFYGANEGEVQASYSGACTKCGLHTELKASQRFWSAEGEVRL